MKRRKLGFVRVQGGCSGGFLRLCARHPGENGCSLFWSGDNIQVAAHVGDARLHICQTVPDGFIGLFQIETIPIVVDLKQGAVRRAPQVNRDFAGIGVLGDIRQGFLADMEQSHCIYLLQV